MSHHVGHLHDINSKNPGPSVDHSPREMVRIIGPRIQVVSLSHLLDTLTCLFRPQFSRGNNYLRLAMGANSSSNEKVAVLCA